MVVTVTEQRQTMPLLMSFKDVVKLLAAGALIGIVTIAIYAVLDKYVFTPALCNDVSVAIGRCENKQQYASALAMVIGGLVGLFAMVQLRIFRPLLVVLLATISLWGTLTMTAGLVWWLSMLVAAGLFMVAYGALAWLVQLRNLWISMVLGIALTVAMRILLTL